VCGGPVLPDAPIVIVRAAAWFIINLFIYLLFYWYRLQIKWDHKKNLNFCGRKGGPGVINFTMLLLTHQSSFSFVVTATSCFGPKNMALNNYLFSDNH
jgi:hypothetical protein